MMDLIVTTLGLFAALFAGLELGRWLRSKSVVPEGGAQAFSAADGVAFAMLGLLIAFTFTAAATRFDERRKLIVDQANALGTAWMRVDLLPEGDREPIRKGMREWVKLVLEVLPAASDLEPAVLNARMKEIQDLQNQSWKAAVAAVNRHPNPQYALLVLTPINDWVNLSTTRLQMNNRGMPPMVAATLIILALVCSVLAGFHMGRSRPGSLLHMFLFTAVITFAIYVTMDLSRPRSGLIRVDSVDDAMRQLYESMKADAPTTMASRAAG